ncbi:MAG: [Fe-Fe] hydrogenase large subunit C-terminal domain-containing protein [Bacillota bacterium]
MGVVSTLEGRCRKCYSCVRHCPAKAIKVENDQARIIPELCIACGHCVTVCSQKAKYVHREIDQVRGFLAGGRAVACLAPAFVAEFYPHALSLVSGLKRMGFTQVHEVAFGACLVTEAYQELLASRERRGLISTACPAVINLVQKHYPELLHRLAPIVSPMIATGRWIKKHYGRHTKVVFIGPCVAKKEEARDLNVTGAVDAVLTFGELRLMLAEYGLELAKLLPSRVDSPMPGMGQVYPLPGGLLKSAALSADILSNEIVSLSGKHACLDYLEGLKAGYYQPEFIDMLFCDGCIAGPLMETDLPHYTRQKVIADYWRLEDKETLGNEAVPKAELNLGRCFIDQSSRRPVPTEQQVREVLLELDKVRPEDELNCGACGYNTCREKAVAVFQGLAENRMCLPYLVNQLEKSNRELVYLKDYNKNIVESIVEGIIVINRQGIVTTFNDSRRQVTDRPAAEVVGRALFQAVPYLDTKEVGQLLSQVLDQGRPTPLEGLRLRVKEKTLVVNIKGYPLRDEKIGVYGAVLIFEDITEKKKLEMQLIEANRLASIGRLAAGIAHEINNPLTLISGYAELLHRETAEDSPAAGWTKVITEEVDRIAVIVRDLLDFARPSPQQLTSCNINEVVNHTLTLVANQLQKREVELEKSFAPGLPEVLVNPNELGQVFLNIILNACHAMPEGGRLRVSTRTVEYRQSRGVQVEFADSGCGIKEEYIQYIFDPFFTTKELGEGTGLGLSVSYGIIKKYEGTIEVSTEYGKGSSFFITLPAID